MVLIVSVFVQPVMARLPLPHETVPYNYVWWKQYNGGAPCVVMQGAGLKFGFMIRGYFFATCG